MSQFWRFKKKKREEIEPTYDDLIELFVRETPGALGLNSLRVIEWKHIPDNFLLTQTTNEDKGGPLF